MLLVLHCVALSLSVDRPPLVGTSRRSAVVGVLAGTVAAPLLDFMLAPTAAVAADAIGEKLRNLSPEKIGEIVKADLVERQVRRDSNSRGASSALDGFASQHALHAVNTLNLLL